MVSFGRIVVCNPKVCACEDCTNSYVKVNDNNSLVIKSGPRGSIFIVETNKNYESSEIELLRVLKDPQDRAILKDPLFFKIKLAGISTSLHT